MGARQIVFEKVIRGIRAPKIFFQNMRRLKTKSDRKLNSVNFKLEKKISKIYLTGGSRNGNVCDAKGPPGSLKRDPFA